MIIPLTNHEIAPITIIYWAIASAIYLDRYLDVHFVVDIRNGVIKRGGQGKSPLKSGENHRIRYEDIGQSTRNGGFFRSHQNGAFPTLADTSKLPQLMKLSTFNR